MVSVKSIDVGHCWTKAEQTMCKQMSVAVLQRKLVYKNELSRDMEPPSAEKYKTKTSSLERGADLEGEQVGCTEPRKREARQEERRGFVGCLLLRSYSLGSISLLNSGIMNIVFCFILT